MKKILSILTMITIIAAVIVACKDNFNESDFLKLQSQLKNSADTAFLNRQLKQLNDAGELLSFTVQVVEDRTPLAGVDVQLSNDVSQSSGTVKVTTDANGNAIFAKVRVGNNTIILSKTGYITTTAVVDFGALSTFYTTATSGGVTTIVPLKQSRSVILPLFSISATGSTATITGKVTIETDLTNNKPEIPQNLTVKANYSSGLAGAVPGGGVTINTYSFNNGGVGSATVDNTTGYYTMTVPATAGGLTMSLIVPEIEGAATMAANFVNSQPANGQPAPQTFPAAMLSATQAASQWSPQFTSGSDPIPTVFGAKAVFSAPPAPGAGLTFSTTAQARPMSVTSNGVNSFTWDTYNQGINPSDQTQFDIGQSVYQLTNRGSGYTASPTVTVSGGSGTGAVMKASLRGVLTGLSITGGGTGYTTGVNVTVTFSYLDNNSVQYDMIFPSVAVTANAGVITGLALPTSGLGWQTVALSSVGGYNVASFKATVSGGGGTGATCTPTFTAEVDHIKLENAGSGFSSAPTVTFGSGGATLVCKEFRTQWAVTPNSTVTTPYSVMPAGITFQFGSTNSGTYNTNGNVYDKFNSLTTLLGRLKASGGVVVQSDPTASYRTAGFSQGAPTAIVTSSVATTAAANLTLNGNGGIASMVSTNNGAGYATPPTVQILPMVTGAPGTGGVVDLSNGTSYNTVTGEYTWNGSSIIVNQGSGYVSNVNVQGSTVNYAGPGSFTLKTGETSVQNISYGTGKRKLIVN